MRYCAPLLLLLLGCGGGWSDADTQASTNAARLELRVLSEYQGVDGGGPVRAMERAALCANESMLYRHGKDVPDSGSVQCQP